MKVTPRKLLGALRWLGLTNRGIELAGPVVVVSPHLDDAVLSLGAAIACSTRNGVEVAILTVFANSIESAAPAGDWDRRAGYRTEGEAARARREEDRRACAHLGARPIWLPFRDQGYGGPPPDQEVAAAIASELRGAETVLIPGFPLQHPDHRWLATLLRRERLGGTRTGEYVEQPYASWWTPGPPEPAGWQRPRAALRDRLAKARACGCYRSQLPLLGPGTIRAISRYEAARGGEVVRWLGPREGSP